MARNLERITVSGYKSLRDVTVELRDLNVLIGANGAGKSNLISVFGMMRDLLRLDVYVDRRAGADALLHFGRKVTERITVRLEFPELSYQVSLAANDADRLFIEDQKGWRAAPGDRRSSSGASPRSEADEHQASRLFTFLTTSSAFSSWQIFHFHDVSENAPVKQRHNLSDHQSLRADARNLAAFLYRLRHAVSPGGETPDEAQRASYQRIVHAVRQVAPYFDDFLLEPDGLRGDLIQLAWREMGSDAQFLPSALSDGTLRFICLATLLLQPAHLLPSVILIDEPELGLHPYGIHLLAALLKSAATKSQVIVSTQSVTLINQFAAEDLIVVDRKVEAGRGYSELRRISEDEIAQWMSDYALGEIWEKNIIGGRPR